MPVNRRAVLTGLLASAVTSPVFAETQMVKGPVQYIAALGDSRSTSGTDAQTWGLWPIDPGPRGVWTRDYPTLAANDNVAPDGWTFDPNGWWVEEYGRIMESPEFPLPPGRYVVTGGREVTSVLTIDPPDATGMQTWSLADGASIYDVTHLRCRAALYTPQSGQTCGPDAVAADAFPVRVADEMPAVAGCNKRDYQVLIVVGMMVET